MERFRFYIKLTTSSGRVYRSDTEGIKEYVERVFMSSANIPIDGCWDKIQHYVDSISDFKSDKQKICLTIDGQATYINPAWVESIVLVRE